MRSIYFTRLSSDISEFAYTSEEKYSEKPITIRAERVKTVGKHALEVAKIKASVIGGIAIAKKTKLL
jgi:hypothetical protein